ncbi:MAG: allophanate hydrolase subunit 2 family protein, partial [Nonomuraea sp.]|nr:allophanate hydrolase subunit 2 family protein [Nonomuraea sp.]
MIEVIAPGPYATVQDLGRPGYAHLGVPRSGAADTWSLRLANRLVGNREDAAGVEMTFGMARLRFHDGAWAALAGAPAEARMGVPFWVPPGGELRLGVPAWGLRTYLAVRGGIAVEPVLGSRSTDSLSGLGPEPLRAGTLLPVGGYADGGIVADLAPLPAPGPAVLRVLPGPRDDWFAP